jgi:hypothetical protein
METSFTKTKVAKLVLPNVVPSREEVLVKGVDGRK